MDKIKEIIKSKLDNNSLGEIYVLLSSMHPADLAELLQEMDVEQSGLILKILDDEKAAMVLQELDPSDQSLLIRFLGKERSSQILEEMFSDDVADLLGELPEAEAQELIDLMEEGEEVQELLDYDEDTAGGIMTTEYIALEADLSVEKAILHLRETAPDAETIYYVYVVDKEEHLLGVLSLRDLIVASPQTPLKEIMKTKIISVDVGADQENVARVVAKYDLLAVPVIDQENHLLGIVTVDDVIDVIEEEATEDIYRLAGGIETQDEDRLVLSLYHSVRARLPWLLVTLIGGILSGGVIRNFTDVLDSIVALAYFMPLIAGMGGNVGTQSSTLMVRGLATGQVDSQSTWRNLFREMLVGLVIGFVCGSLVALVAYFWQGKVVLGFIVGTAMAANILSAAVIGTLVPLVFRRVGVDPAVASAPFISTTIDITGLSIYFTLTTLLIKNLL